MAKPRQQGDRLPPPPRMSGAGLNQIALFAGLMAVLMAFLGIFLAGSSTDPAKESQVDQLGAAACAALTIHDPEVWAADYGTSTAYKKSLQKYYRNHRYPGLERSPRVAMQNNDVKRTERNKKRIGDAIGSQNLAAGVVRGIQLVFDVKGLTSQHAGAQINPREFERIKRIGDVDVGLATAVDAISRREFAARVYRRTYRNKGEAFIIISQSAVRKKKGAGLWLGLGPLLVGAAIALLLIQVNKASAGMKTLARDLDVIGRGKLDHRIFTGSSGETGYAQKMADRMARNLQLMQSTGSTDIDGAHEKELDLAKEIHMSLRPSDPPRVPGFELETLFRGGSQIGGDYFDTIELDETRIALVIADCSDSLRGVPAAMVMAMTRAYIKAAVDPDAGPADWLRWVNRRLARDLKSGMAVTALVAVLDAKSGEVTAASAGHRPIVMWRKGKTATINPNGIALGLDVGPVFDKTIEEKRFTMHKNDRIVLYTDGVISAENEAGEAYGDERFMESIRRQGAMNSAAFVNFVAGGVEKFLDGLEQSDDITIFTLKKMK